MLSCSFMEELKVSLQFAYSVVLFRDQMTLLLVWLVSNDRNTLKDKIEFIVLHAGEHLPL